MRMRDKRDRQRDKKPPGPAKGHLPQSRPISEPQGTADERPTQTPGRDPPHNREAKAPDQTPHPHL